MDTTPNLGMAELPHGSYNGEVVFNADIQILDFFAQASVVNHAQDGEPAAPAEGSAYVISANPWSQSGEAGAIDDIAHYYNGTWHFYRPLSVPNAIGWRVISQVDLNTYYWDGVSWGIYNVGSLLVHDVAADADYTLSGQEAKHQAVKVTDTGVLLTVGRNIIVPVSIGQYVFINATAQTLTLKTSAGAGIAVVTAKNAILFCDGVDVIRLSQDSS